jgi:hypothetical protein
LAANRFANQSTDLSNFMQKTMGSDLNSQSVIDGLKQSAENLVTPAYKAAYAEGANGVWSDKLSNLLQSPDVASAINKTNKTAINDAVINGQPIIGNPFNVAEDGTISLATDANGNRAIPSLQYWDSVKKNIGDMENAAYLNRNNNYAAQLTNLRKQLVSELDSQVPSYAKARDLSYANFNAKDAFSAGQKFLGLSKSSNLDPMLKDISKFSEPEKELFSQGFASEISRKALNAPDRQNVLSMFNSPAMRQKIQVGLNTAANPDRSNQIEAYLRNMNIQDKVRTAVASAAPKGATTPVEGLAYHGKTIGDTILHGLSAPASGAMLGAGEAAYNYGFDPEQIAKHALIGGSLGLLKNGLSAGDAKVANIIGQKLLSSNPDDIHAALQAAAKNPKIMDNFRKIEMGLTYTGIEGAQGLNNSETEKSSIARASGGRVKKSHEFLVNRLMKLAEYAKKDENTHTKSLLGANDEAVVRALAIAQKHI